MRWRLKQINPLVALREIQNLEVPSLKSRLNFFASTKIIMTAFSLYRYVCTATLRDPPETRLQVKDLTVFYYLSILCYNTLTFGAGLKVCHLSGNLKFPGNRSKILTHPFFHR
jgi:hypothetical protein